MSRQRHTGALLFFDAVMLSLMACHSQQLQIAFYGFYDMLRGTQVAFLLCQDSE